MYTDVITLILTPLYLQSTWLSMKFILLIYYPGIQFRLPCTPPGQFFMGAKLFIGTPWMGNEGVLKKIGLGYMKLHDFYANR